MLAGPQRAVVLAACPMAVSAPFMSAGAEPVAISDARHYVGKYLFKNVKRTFAGYPGGEATSESTMRLSRAD